MTSKIYELYGRVLSLGVLVFLLCSCVKPKRETAAGPVDKVLKGTWTWDVDSQSDGTASTSDLWWEHVDSHERYLVPQNGAGLAVLKGASFEQLPLSALKSSEFSTNRVSVSDTRPAIEVGTVLALRTSKNNYAKLQVVGFEPLGDVRNYHLKLRYVLYTK